MIHALFTHPAIIISAIALVISFFTFILNTPAENLKREQRAQMNILATRVTLVYDALATLASSVVMLKELTTNPDPHTQQRAEELLNQQLCFLPNAAKHLQESLNTMMGLRLFEQVWDRGSLKYPIATYGRFSAVLDSAIQNSQHHVSWLNDTLLNGIRQLISCLSQDEQLDNYFKAKLEALNEKKPKEFEDCAKNLDANFNFGL